MLKNYLITSLTSCENLKLIKARVSNPDLALLFIPLCERGSFRCIIQSHILASDAMPASSLPSHCMRRLPPSLHSLQRPTDWLGLSLFILSSWLHNAKTCLPSLHTNIPVGNNAQLTFVVGLQHFSMGSFTPNLKAQERSTGNLATIFSLSSLVRLPRCL